jgi:hypothetical protein
VVKYLARYVRGGPIKDQRFVAFEGEQVTFRCGRQRDPEARGQPRPPTVTLAVEEFLRRWSEHVPLPGVHTVRAWGLYASTQRPKLAQGRAQVLAEETPLETLSGGQDESPRDRDRPWEVCPVCHQRLVVTQVLPRAGAPPRVEAWPVAA